jgi:hypothetical protein
MKMTFQNVGSSTVLFLYGTKEEIVGRGNSLYNWAGTNGELKWLSDGCAICWSSPKQLLNYFFQLAIMELWDDTKKGKKHGVEPEARKLAQERFNAVPQEESSLRWADGIDVFEMGVIAAEKPDDDLLDYFVTRGLMQS